MKYWPALLSLLLPACTAMQSGTALAPNPLVGTWNLERYVDIPEGGAPVHAFGTEPRGLFIFTANGYVSISIMRNPPAVGETSVDPDPDACIPAWYCAYFGTYRYEPTGPAWVTHVTGGNIPSYLGTDQHRRFELEGDRMTILESYMADGITFHAERVLRRATVRSK